MKGARRVSKFENACAPAASPCIVYIKLTICPKAVLKCFGGLLSILPLTPLKPSVSKSFKSQPTQYTDIIFKS